MSYDNNKLLCRLQVRCMWMKCIWSEKFQMDHEFYRTDLFWLIIITHNIILYTILYGCLMDF